MEFHLLYDGKLPAAGSGGTRAKEKHGIRKVFHRQLRNLWNTQPFLREFVDAQGKFSAESGPPQISLANRYLRCGYRFLPLVSDWFMASCALDILFLRRDGPGSLIKSGGDIDNRLKVLFDALRMPQTSDEVCGESPSPDEDPFFCLLEDDRLISKTQIEANWLLTPTRPDEHVHDVHLVIRVRTIASGSKEYEAAFH